MTKVIIKANNKGELNMIASVIQILASIDALMFACGFKSVTGWICDKIGV